MWRLIGRVLLYGLWTVLVALAATAEGYWEGTNSHYGEASLVEAFQTTFLVLAAVLFYLTARTASLWRGVCTVFVFMLSIAAIREQDSFLDHNVADGVWQLIALGLLVWLCVYLWRYPGSIAREALSFAESRGAGLLLAGFLTVFVFSRIAGMQTFWRSVMGDQYLRVVKNFVEEGTELFGYSLLVVAAMETFIQIRGLVRGQAADVRNDSGAP